MKFLVVLLAIVRLCISASDVDIIEPYQVKTVEKIEALFEQISLMRNQVRGRISAGTSSDEDIRENDYMPEGLKELIAKKLAEMPDNDCTGNDRIFGGSIAPRNSYPYLVGMSLSLTGGTSWCGGSILSDSYVITAAHCLDNVRSVTIMFGAHDRINIGEPGRQQQIVSKANFIVHRGWNSQKMLNDIALIRLNTKLQFSNTIQPISLSAGTFTYEGQNGIISGWGHYDSSKQLSRYIRHTQSRIVNNSICAQYFQSYIQIGNVCLDGSRGQGTCNGDSGGPLVIQSSDGKGILVGLTSFGSGQGCDRGWPTVFTKVSYFKTWISQNSGLKFE